MVSSHMQSVDTGFTGVFSMFRALDPPGWMFCTPGTSRSAGTATSAFLPVLLSVVGEDRLMLCLKTHSYTFLSCCLAQAVLLHWEQGQNTALILHYATISLKMLPQLNMASPEVPVVSVQVLVCAEHKCHRLLHFFSWEQEDGIRSDQIPSDDVCLPCYLLTHGKG